MTPLNTATKSSRIDDVVAADVHETLEWVRLGKVRSIHYSAPKTSLCFVPNAEYGLAAMANLGYQLLQEIKAYRPDFTWQTSAAEIIGALIEEVHGGSKCLATPSAVLIADEVTQ